MYSRDTSSAELPCLFRETFESLDSLFGNGGAIVGAAVWSPGKLDCAAGGGVKYTSSPDAVKWTRQFTLEIEFDVPAVIPARQVLMAVRSAAGNQRFTLALTTGAQIELTATAAVTCVGNLSVGRHLVHVVVRRTGSVDFYVDGSFRSSNINVALPEPTWPTGWADWITLGIDYDSVSNGFTGVLRAVNVYKAAFSSLDVSRAAAGFVDVYAIIAPYILANGGQWLDPTMPGAFVYATISGLTDLNMAAPGTTPPWNFTAGVTALSKVPVGTGPAQMLRVSTVLGGLPSANQAGVPTGERILLAGYGRGDGVAGRPRVSSAGGGPHWFVGTNSTALQPFENDITPTTSSLILYATNVLAPGDYADFVFTKIANLSVNQVNLRMNQGFSAGEERQSTGTVKPWAPLTTPVAITARQVLQFDTGDQLNSTAPASEWSFMHDGSGGTLFFVFYPTAMANALLQHTTNTSSVGLVTGFSLYMTAAGVLQLLVQNGTGVDGFSGSSGVPVVALTTPYVITVASSLASCFVDVNDVNVIAPGPIVNPSAAAPFLTLATERNTLGTPMLYMERVVVKGPPNALRNTAIVAALRGKWGF